MLRGLESGVDAIANALRARNEREYDEKRRAAEKSERDAEEQKQRDQEQQDFTNALEARKALPGMNYVPPRARREAQSPAGQQYDATRAARGVGDTRTPVERANAANQQTYQEGQQQYLGAASGLTPRAGKTFLGLPGIQKPPTYKPPISSVTPEPKPMTAGQQADAEHKAWIREQAAKPKPEQEPADPNQLTYKGRKFSRFNLEKEVESAKQDGQHTVNSAAMDLTLASDGDFDLNALPPNEVQQFVDYMNEYGASAREVYLEIQNTALKRAAGGQPAPEGGNESPPPETPGQPPAGEVDPEVEIQKLRDGRATEEIIQEYIELVKASQAGQ